MPQPNNAAHVVTNTKNADTNAKNVNTFTQSMPPRLLWMSVPPGGSSNMRWGASNSRVKARTKPRGSRLKRLKQSQKEKRNPRENRLIRLEKSQKEKRNRRKNAPEKITRLKVNKIVLYLEDQCGYGSAFN